MNLDLDGLNQLPRCVRHTAIGKYKAVPDLNGCAHCLRRVIAYVLEETARVVYAEGNACKNHCGKRLAKTILCLGKRARNAV